MVPHISSTGETPGAWRLRILVAAGLLALALLGPRAYLLHRASFERWPNDHPLRDCAKLWLSGSYDSAFVMGLAAVALGILLLSQGWRIAGPVIYRTFLLAATVTLVAAIINVEFIRVAGRPFNFQWFYYSDFLQSADSFHVVLSSLTWKMTASLIFAPLAYVLASVAVGRRVARGRHTRFGDKLRWIAAFAP